MGELEVYRPARLSRQTTRQLRAVDRNTALARAAAKSDEATTAYRAQLRIDNGSVLASQATQNAAQLNRQITQATRDNPGLEMLLRVHVEEPTIIASGILVTRYMLRP